MRFRSMSLCEQWQQLFIPTKDIQLQANIDLASDMIDLVLQSSTHVLLVADLVLVSFTSFHKTF